MLVARTTSYSWRGQRHTRGADNIMLVALAENSRIHLNQNGKWFTMSPAGTECVKPRCQLETNAKNAEITMR